MPFLRSTFVTVTSLLCSLTLLNEHAKLYGPGGIEAELDIMNVTVVPVLAPVPGMLPSHPSFLALFFAFIGEILRNEDFLLAFLKLIFPLFFTIDLYLKLSIWQSFIIKHTKRFFFWVSNPFRTQSIAILIKKPVEYRDGTSQTSFFGLKTSTKKQARMAVVQANLIRDVQHARRTARRLSQENQTFVSRLRQILDPKETYNACTNMLHVAKRVRNCLDNKTSDTEKTIARLLESTVDPLDHEVVQKNLERARENLKAVRETIRRLEAKVKAQDQEKKQRRHAAAGLDASTQTDKPERKGNAHRASLEEAKSRISQLQANLSKQEADAAQLVAKSADEISRLRDEQAATEGKLSQSQANLDEISKQYHASEQAKEEAKAVLAALKSELDDAHASLDAQSGQASAQDGTISHLTASIKTLEEALARLETNNAVKEQLKKDLEVTITTLQKSLEGTVSRADAEKQCKEEVDRRLKIVLPALKKAAESNMEKLLKVKESSLEGQFKLKVQSQVLVRVAECLPHELKKQLDISGSLVRQAFDNAVRAQVEQGKFALESNYQDALNSRLQFQHEQYQSEVNVTAAAHGNELEGLRQTLADLQNRLQFVENDADTARSEADAQRTLAKGYAGTLNALSAALEDVPSATSTINQGDGGIPSETQNQDEAPIHPFEFSIDVGELSNLPIFDFNTGEFLPGTQLQDAVPAAPLDVGPDAGELTHTRIFNLEAGGVPSGAQNRDQVPDAPFNVNLDFGAVAAFNEPSSAALPALSIPESTSAFTEPLSNFHEDWQVDDATWDSIYGGDEGSLDEPTNFIVNSEQMNRLERLARRREKAPATAQEAENSGSLERDGREPELHDAQDPNSAEEDCAYDTDDQAAWAEAFEKAGFMDAVADTARNDEESTVPLPGQFIANHNRPMRRPRARARRPVGTPAATTGNIAGAVPASDGNEVIDNTPRSPPPEEIEDMNDAFNAEQEAKAQYYKAKAEKEKADREKVAEEAQVAEEDL